MIGKDPNHLPKFSSKEHLHTPEQFPNEETIRNIRKYEKKVNKNHEKV